MGFLTSVLQDVRKARALQEHQASFARARLALQTGQTGPMQFLAESGLGDAWAALATYKAELNSPESQREATRLYEMAGKATEWVESYASVWQDEYETRCFLGIGADPDYKLLYRSWSQGHFKGYQREIELAWIATYALENLHNAAVAWEWLALDEARWGKRREARLPAGNLETLRAKVAENLPAKQRTRIEETAKSLASAEFAEGR